MPTPHNSAQVNEVAKTVLMPGDPLRAKYLVEHYLTDVKLINSVRNMYGYTGKYKGVEVSVMGGGMGMPSVGIYSYELFKFYNVENIIRIGTAGAYVHELNVFDLVLAKDAFSESTYAKVLADLPEDVQKPSAELNKLIMDTAKELGVKVVEDTIHSSDVFYHLPVSNYLEEVKKHNCCCVEMESFALFANARVTGKKAACILTISDSLVTHQETTPKERETLFNNMMVVALEAAIKL